MDTLGYLRANNKWTGNNLEVAIVAIAASSECEVQLEPLRPIRQFGLGLVRTQDTCVFVYACHSMPSYFVSQRFFLG